MVFSFRYLFQCDSPHEAIPSTFDQNFIVHVPMVDSLDNGSTKHNHLVFGYFLWCDFSLFIPFKQRTNTIFSFRVTFFNHFDGLFSFINSILLITSAIFIDFEINATLQMMLFCFDSDQFIRFSMQFSINRKYVLVSTCFESTSIAEFERNVLIGCPITWHSTAFDVVHLTCIEIRNGN